MLILKGEKRGGLYKLKEGNSVQGETLGISLKESSSQGEASRKTAMGREPGQSVAGKRNGALMKGLRWPKASR